MFLTFDQYLQYANQGPPGADGADGAPGLITLLDDQYLAAPAAQIAFGPTIDQTFHMLEVVFKGRSTRAAQSVDNLHIRVNGSNNLVDYYSANSRVQHNATLTTGERLANFGAMELASVLPAATSPVDAALVLTIRCYSYTIGVNGQIYLEWHGFVKRTNAAGNQNMVHGGGQFTVPFSTITSLQLFAANGNLDTNSEAQLWAY